MGLDLSELERIGKSIVGIGSPLRPENQGMVDKQGVEITEHPNAGASIDQYRKTREVRIFSNDAGKQIKGITLEPDSVAVQYKDGRPDFVVPVKDDVFTSAEYSVNMAENSQRNVPLNIKIAGKGKEGAVAVILQQNQKSWPQDVSIDVSRAPFGTSVKQNIPNTKVTVDGLSPEQIAAVSRNPGHDVLKMPGGLELNRVFGQLSANTGNGSMPLGNGETIVSQIAGKNR